MDERGIVMAVLDKAFDVLVLRLGVVKRVYLDVRHKLHNFELSREPIHITISILLVLETCHQ